MGAPRRETDAEDEDFRERRGGPLNLNGNTKWVISAALAAVLGVAGWGVQQDRAQVERRLNAVEAIGYSSQVTQARLETQLQEIQRSLDKIERTLDREKQKR